MASLVTLLVSGTAISRVPFCLERLQLNNISRQDLTLVKQRFPDVPRNCFPAQDFTSLDMGSSSVPSLPRRPSSNNCINEPASGVIPTTSEDLESDHGTALAIIPNSCTGSRQSILQGWTSNGEDNGFFTDGISLSDVLSKLKRMCFYHRTSLPLNRDLATILTELEADHNTNALELVTKYSETLRQSNLPGMTAKEDGICLAANDFLKRITYVSESDLVFFPVPQSNLQAFTVCAVCSCFDEDMSASRISIRVTNHTKLLPRYDIQPIHLNKLTSHEVICQAQIPINQLKLEGDDFVEVEVVTGSGLRVKKTGVCLVWDPDVIIENMVDCEPLPYENFPKMSSSTACRNNSRNFTLIKKSASENVMVYIPTPAKRPEEGVEVVQADANPPSPGWTYVSRRNQQATSRNNEECLEAGQTEGKKKLKVYGRRKPALVKPGLSFRDVANGQGVVLVSDDKVIKKSLEGDSIKSSSNQEEVFANFDGEENAPYLNKEDDMAEYDGKVINGKRVLVFRYDGSDMNTEAASRKCTRDMTEENNMAEAVGDEGSASFSKMSKK